MAVKPYRPTSRFWVEEIWFEPEIRSCLNPDQASVMFVTVRNQRGRPVDDVVLTVEALELRSSDGVCHRRNGVISFGCVRSGETASCDHSVLPAHGDTDVYEVTLLGTLTGYERDSGVQLSVPVAFWCDAEDRIWLKPEDAELVACLPRWTKLRKAVRQDR
ncbi:MAG: hypothetical protein DI591_11970 [Citromicrobium sp.]|nr:MAG: hypothetical protein DI591_11970 [Citromicrobium sp.]